MLTSSSSSTTTRYRATATQISCRRRPMKMMMKALLLVLALLLFLEAEAFLPQQHSTSTATSLHVFGGNTQSGLSNLPQGISPFEKKRSNVQAELRKLAERAIIQGLADGKTQLELEFPPLLGEKSQFDDLDNVQELNKNRDWCVELLPALAQRYKNIWLVLPDLKEVELCKEEWGGKLYRDAARFTSIQAVTEHYSSEEYAKPWGATIAGLANQIIGGNTLGDERALDTLEGDCDLHLVCQPGNGGPVEDWINVKAFAFPICVVNGALDKVRDGYYAPFIFPKLARTFDFYRNFEAMLFLKPVSDKGVYGWVFRVYPEPWQVVLQTPVRNKKDELEIEESVALVSDTRPSYQEAVQALLMEASKRS